MPEDRLFAVLTLPAVTTDGPTAEHSYVDRVLCLTLLAPDIVEAILDGRQPEGMTLPGLLKRVPVEWEGQSRLWHSQSEPIMVNPPIRDDNRQLKFSTH